MGKATFAAGSFWEVQAAYDRVPGVVSTQAGYVGGTLEDPTYHDVCRGTTGHALAVEVEYDPSVVSYDELLSVFWKIHDPTTSNRQGEFVGPQYRSAIFFHTPEQQQAAEASREKRQRSGRLTKTVATEVVPAPRFYKAEEYHQRYLAKRGFRSLRPGR